MSKPLATYMLDTYKFHWPDQGVEMVLDRFNEDKREGLMAEITVSTSLAGWEGLLHQGRLNLSSTRSRTTLANALDKRVNPEVVDWSGLLEQVCFLALKRWRDGDPLIDLAHVELRDSTHYLLEPFLEDSGVTLLFAKGGVGKSLIALGIAATIALDWPVLGIRAQRTCPVLYLDWEADEQAHAERLRAICAGMGEREIPSGLIHYRRQVASMAESAPALRRLIAEHGIGFVVIDSMGAARGGDPESAETTIKMFGAARSLGVPVLGIDHLSKGALNGGDNSMPFGSVYSYNLSRLAWGVDHIAQREDGDRTSTIVALRNTKSNNGRLHHRLAYEMRFEPGLLAFEETDVRDVPEAITKLSQPEQVLAAIRRNSVAASVADIQEHLQAEGINIPDNQVRALLSRLKERQQVVPVGSRWGIAVRN